MLDLSAFPVLSFEMDVSCHLRKMTLEVLAWRDMAFGTPIFHVLFEVIAIFLDIPVDTYLNFYIFHS